MASGKLLVYLLRRDLRVADNPILHHLAAAKDHGFTHLLPIFIFPAHQIEVSGFIDDDNVKSPYPQARSAVGKFYRTGPHRAKFLAQSVWSMKTALEDIGSGLVVRVGKQGEVLQHLVEQFKDEGTTLGAVWMTEEKSSEEIREQKDVASVCADNGIDFKLWADEKYFIDDRDTGLNDPKDLPDVFTAYRKSQEPLRERPRPPLPPPEKDTLPAFPEPSSIPEQHTPFVSVRSGEELEMRLLKPLKSLLYEPPKWPDGGVTSHPFRGGEQQAWERLQYLIKSNAMSKYKDTRNGLIGLDFSTKLSAYLALGCITARQIHRQLIELEEGLNEDFKHAKGYGEGESEGTASMRFELLWRDYMHLCTAKFGTNLFKLEGFRQQQDYHKTWLAPEDGNGPHVSPSKGVAGMLKRFLEGTTGMGFIDASQRELYHTGYTSNRARQNVASFLTKHLQIDWRYGAEWYECMLVDYDVSSNWANWQYVAGVGNDPRGDARIFNPVKQAFDYDADGTFVKMWMPEVRTLSKLENYFQPWTSTKRDIAVAGLKNNIMVTDPLKQIHFTIDRRPNRSGKGNNSLRNKARKRGGGRGGGGSGGDAGAGAGAAPNGHHENGEGDGGAGGPVNGAGKAAGRGGRGGGRGWRGGSSPNTRNRAGPRTRPSADDQPIEVKKYDTRLPPSTMPYGGPSVVNGSNHGAKNGSPVTTRGTGPWQTAPGDQQYAAGTQTYPQSQPQHHSQSNGYPFHGGYDYNSPPSSYVYVQQPMNGQPMHSHHVNGGYHAYPQSQPHPVAPQVWAGYGQWHQPVGYVAQQPMPQPPPAYYSMPPPPPGTGHYPGGM